MKRFLSILLLILSVQCAVGIFAQGNGGVSGDAKAADKLRKTEVKKQLNDAKINLKQNRNLDKVCILFPIGKMIIGIPLQPIAYYGMATAKQKQR